MYDRESYDLILAAASARRRVQEQKRLLRLARKVAREAVEAQGIGE